MDAIFFLAEDVSPATFKRSNFQGCIMGDSVTVPEFPYRLATHVVALFQHEEGLAFTASVRLRLRIGFSSELAPEQTVESVPEDCSASGEESARRAIVVVPIAWRVFGPGTLSARIQVDDDIVSEMSWKIDAGAGPLRGVSAPALTGEIISKGASFDVTSLLGSATKDLVIVDAYLPPDVLSALLERVGKHVSIRVLVPPKDAKAYTASKAELHNDHPNLELRVQQTAVQQGVFHDRFVVLNSHEAYCFGTSLKQVDSGRVTRVAKLFQQQEVDGLMKVIDSEWAASKPI